MEGGGQEVGQQGLGYEVRHCQRALIRAVTGSGVDIKGFSGLAVHQLNIELPWLSCLVTKSCYESIKSLSRVQLSWTPWTIARQAPLSMEFSRQKYWSG